VSDQAAAFDLAVVQEAIGTAGVDAWLFAQFHGRDTTVDLVKGRYVAGEEVRGFEADKACREVLVNAGYGDAVQHRTGHSITREIHGSGANLDDFESHDERLLMRCTCFSVEPGIYLEDDFGVRSEVDVLVPPDGPPEVTGRKQTAMILLLVDDPQYR
jgi:hypothetical protein